MFMSEELKSMLREVDSCRQKMTRGSETHGITVVCLLYRNEDKKLDHEYLQLKNHRNLESYCKIYYWGEERSGIDRCSY